MTIICPYCKCKVKVSLISDTYCPYCYLKVAIINSKGEVVEVGRGR